MHEQYILQPTIVVEPEIQAPRGKEWQWGVVDTWAVGSMVIM